MDTAGTVHISDADKGAAAAYAKNFVNSHAGICREHRAVTAILVKKFGMNGKQLYINYASAYTEAASKAALREMSPDMQTWVNAMPRKNQCRIGHPGILHGNLTSNQVESQNKPAVQVRWRGLKFNIDIQGTF